MYEIMIEKIFCAAHAIRLYGGSLEPMHGHNWPIAITVASQQLDDIEVVLDFHELGKTGDGLMAQAHNRSQTAKADWQSTRPRNASRGGWAQRWPKPCQKVSS